MNTAPSNGIVERIKKLLALSTSPNEFEAMAAANKAHALLAEHNLSLDEVQTTDEDEDENIVYDSELMTKESKPWRRPIGAQVAKMYFCKYVYRFDKLPTPHRATPYSRRDVHSFIGTPSNVAISKIMFMYLTETVERLAKEGARDYPVRERSSYSTSFKNACANRLAHRIHERIEAAKRGELQTESGKNLPALLNTYLAVQNQLDAFVNQKFGRALKATKSRAKSSNMMGVLDGRAQGDRIGLDPQLNGAGSARRLTGAK